MFNSLILKIKPKWCSRECDTFIVNIKDYAQEKYHSTSLGEKISWLITFALKAIVWVLGFCVLVIFCFLIWLLILISLLVLRVFQFVRCSSDDGKMIVHYNHLARSVIILISLPIMVVLLLSIILDRPYVPRAIEVLDLPLSTWGEIVLMICGTCTVGSGLYGMAPIYVKLFIRGTNNDVHVDQAISELVEILIHWFVTYNNGLAKRFPSIKHYEIGGLPTPEWIKVIALVLIGSNLIPLFAHVTVYLMRTTLFRPSHENKGTDWRELLKFYSVVKYAMYYAKGMTISICFIINSLLLLLVWILYFGKHLDMNSPTTTSIWEYGKWTCISLLTYSVLCLIKTTVLLVWEAHTVYDRLWRRILSSSKQLYFLGLVGSNKHDALSLRQNYDEVIQHQELTQKIARAHPINLGIRVVLFVNNFIYGFNRRKNMTPRQNKRKEIHKDLLIQVPTNPKMDEIQRVDDIQQATHYFLEAKEALSRETYISDILLNFGDQSRLTWKKLLLGEEVVDDTNEGQEGSHAGKESEEKSGEEVAQNSNLNNTSGRGGGDVEQNNGEITEQKELAEECSTGNNPVQENVVQDKQGQQNDSEWKEDLDHFLGKLKDIKKESSDSSETEQENSNPEIPFSFSDAQTWVERAHSQCLNLANTLSNAKELADLLDKIISWVLIGAIMIMWLLLTGLATTKVLVLIASPLLAATFIFGESCKTLFQGIIYVFVVHPLDVGDLCVINDKMLEVRSMDVWTTTFTKVEIFGTQKELVIYSNTELKSKIIINYKTKFDWSDRLEFKLGRMKEINNKNKRKVIKFFTDYLDPHTKMENGVNPDEKEEDHLKLVEEKEKVVNPEKKEEDQLKLAKQKGKAVKFDDDKEEEEEKNVKQPSTEEKDNDVKQSDTKEAVLEKKFFPFLSKMPNLSVLANEDNIILVIRLEYNVTGTDKWTYSECLRKKDDLKGDFHIYVQDVVREFKKGFAGQETQEIKVELLGQS